MSSSVLVAQVVKGAFHSSVPLPGACVQRACAVSTQAHKPLQKWHPAGLPS